MGTEATFFHVVLLWAGRTAILALLASLLGWLGIAVLDVLTPGIHQRQRIGEHPVSVGLFVGGFMIMIGLVIHGAVTGPVLVGSGLLRSLIEPVRLGLIAVSFFVSLLTGILLLHMVDRLTPGIRFSCVDEDPIAVGVYVFGYLVFFGLILHGALAMPL
ncbi:MAG: DUF350 domain-containing protein [Dehalococcoidia bacterium]|nr:MAG: DUF350 domain-containing protein [Dehalococcoidia bacterium]